MGKVYTFLKKIIGTSVFLVVFGYAHVTQASHLAYKNVNQNSSKVEGISIGNRIKFKNDDTIVSSWNTQKRCVSIFRHIVSFWLANIVDYWRFEENYSDPISELPEQSYSLFKKYIQKVSELDKDLVPGNCACAYLILYDNNNKVVNNCDVDDTLIDEYVNKVEDRYLGDINENITDFLNKYSNQAPVLSNIINLLEKEDKQYLPRLRDNELRILLNLYDKILSNTIKCENGKIKIKLFTYRDMCPLCWTIWKLCLPELQRLISGLN